MATVSYTHLNGIDILRIFDALNDVRNLRTSIKAAKKEGAHAQVAISYTTGDVFTDDYYVKYAKVLESEGDVYKRQTAAGRRRIPGRTNRHQ